MKLGPAFAFLFAASLASGAEANDFKVPVSDDFSNDDIEIHDETALMKFDYFIEQVGQRTVYSEPATIGHKTHDEEDRAIYAHATFVINTRKRRGENTTVNIDRDQVHITSWYPSLERQGSAACQVFENGRCTCEDEHSDHWNICENRQLVQIFASNAIAARRAATRALEAKKVTVTDNPAEH